MAKLARAVNTLISRYKVRKQGGLVVVPCVRVDFNIDRVLTDGPSMYICVYTQNACFSPEEIRARAAVLTRKGHEENGKPDRPAAWKALERFEKEEMEVLGGPALVAEAYGLYQEVRWG